MRWYQEGCRLMMFTYDGPTSRLWGAKREEGGEWLRCYQVPDRRHSLAPWNKDVCSGTVRTLPNLYLQMQVRGPCYIHQGRHGIAYAKRQSFSDHRPRSKSCTRQTSVLSTLDRLELLIRASPHFAHVKGEEWQIRLIGSYRRSQGRLPHAR